MVKYEKLLEKENSKVIKIDSKPQEPLKVPYPPKEGINILDALSATGLRSVRYLKEIPGVNTVTINDLDPLATAAARNNCKNNNVDEDKVTFNTGNAVSLMYDASIDHDKQFDVIDLDPYGTACPFIDSVNIIIFLLNSFYFIKHYIIFL
jgi:tRNA (guanine26-N2/guanine27-N2)-dimethyltransferase